MLFELARAGKKVLFVSQNREAIDVVIRKYKDLNKEMRIGDTDLSFLDFCLHLSDPSQRTIKYIKELRTRLYKSSQRITGAKPIDNELPYAIVYTRLDKEANENPFIDDDERGDLGIDELLASSLKFVKNNNIIKCPLRQTGKIDARSVFRSLDEHKEKSESFKYYCNPSGALSLLAPICDEAITIGGIQNSVQSILNQYEATKGLESVTCQRDMDMERALYMLAMISNVNELFSLATMRQDGVSFRDLSTALKEASSLKDKMADVVTLDIELPDTEIFCEREDKELLECSNLKELLKLKEAYEEVLSILDTANGDNKDYFFIDIIAMLIKANGIDVDSLFAKYDFKNFKAEDIRDFARDLREWRSQGAFIRLLSNKPQSLAALSGGDIAMLAQYYLPTLDIMADVLDGTDFKASILQKIIRSQKNALKIKGSIGGSKLISLANRGLKILDQEYDSLLKSRNAEQLRKLLDRRIDEIGQYFEIVSATNKLSNEYVSDTVDIINGNIVNRGIMKAIDSVCGSKLAYFRVKKNEELLDYIDRIEGPLTKKSGMIDELLSAFDFDKTFDNAKADDIQDLQDKILDAEKEKIFSDKFFEIKKGEKISLWMSKIETLLTYGNRQELAEFIEHNDFIGKINKALGEQNRDYLRKYLEMELDYSSFAEHIAYDLVRSIYDDIPASKCKTIDLRKYFADFSSNLDKLRNSYYRETMSQMSLKYEDPARRLASPVNWRPAESVMAKISANTDMIIEAYPVIMATPSEVSKYIAPKKELFDYVIFDEASQLLPGQAIPSIYRAKKAVIVGDPHQMPPTSSVMIGAQDNENEADLEDLGDSILDLVKSMQIDAAYHLKVHYRSKYNILFEPSRKAIYAQDDIRPIIEAKSIKMPLYIRDNLGEDEEVGYATIIERVNGYINKNPDATFCILFTRMSGNGSETGFKKYLEGAGSEVGRILKKYGDEEILISTVTNCQGISGNHTILFIPSYASPRAMWFFKSNAGAYKRLNVSITRQTESLDIIMGDDKAKWITVCRGMMQDDDTAPDTLLSAELMEGLLTNAGRQIDEEYLERKLGPNADSIDSPLAEQVYDMLSEYLSKKYGNEVRVWCEVGYKIRSPDAESRRNNDYNVGYRIDIGVYSTRHKCFILGIEMDGATYHSGYEKEFSDSQRQEILESKGWNIYRIWSTNWLNDRDGEFKALVEVIETELAKDPVIEDDVYLSVSQTNGEELSEDAEQELFGEEVTLSDEEKDVSSGEYILPDDPAEQLLYWKRLDEYLKTKKELGKPIEIKFGAKNLSKEQIRAALLMPYQELLVTSMMEDYILARHSGIPTPYKFYKNTIIAFKNDE